MDTPAEIKERLLSECNAMVLYIAARGIDKEMPDRQMLGLLDTTGEARDAVSTSDVLVLHQNLSRIVSPALPETIERLHRFKKFPIFWRMAPLGSVLWLIITTLLLVGLFGYGLTAKSHRDLPAAYFPAWEAVYGEPAVADPSSEKIAYFQPVVEYIQGRCRLSEAEYIEAKGIDTGQIDVDQFSAELLQHAKDCQSLRRPLLLRIFMFFGALGMLGAAYSSIYDSFSYIREGRYDMRLASSYYVRIFLGGFSGILLAEPLSDFLEQGVLSSALLAFIGGFSAQLVYDLLTKLVDSVANMFRADRRKEFQEVLAQAEFAARGVILEDDAAKRNSLAQMLADAQKEPDPARRAERMHDAILAMLSGKLGAVADPAPAPDRSGTSVQVQDAILLADLSRQLAGALPDASPETEAAAAAALETLEQAQRALAQSTAHEVEAAAKAALADARAADLVTGTVEAGVEALERHLQGAALSAVVKGGLVSAALLDPARLARWRYVAYEAMEPDASLLEGIDASEIETGLRTAADAEITPATLLTSLGTDDTDSLFDANAAAFADRAAFDAAVADWIDQTVRAVLATELAGSVIPAIASTISSEDLVAALSRVAGNETARGGLQRLELVASGVPDCKAPEQTLRRLIGLAAATLNSGDQA